MPRRAASGRATDTASAACFTRRAARRNGPVANPDRAAGRLNHPGTQLRYTDADRMQLTCYATNTEHIPIAEPELRRRQRARAEERIRAARSTGLRNLPLHDAAQNLIWLETVQIALDLLAWMPMLALTGGSRLWGPAVCGCGYSPPPPSSSPPDAAASSASRPTGPAPTS